MAWFVREKYKLKSPIDKNHQNNKGLWKRCDNCGEVIYNREWEENLRVCPKCNYHYPLSGMERIQLLADEGTFKEYNRTLVGVDILSFTDTKGNYGEKLKSTLESTGSYEAIITGTAKLYGIGVELAVMDFSFLGGSMGSAVGEKIVRMVNIALKNRNPAIILSCSGGARMHEGAISLMQMAKTCAALTKLSKAKLPYISVLTNPTTGGVSASYAMIGDVNIAEPNALIGFAGPRVIEQTIKQKLPEGFQRSEFVQDHGFIDLITKRNQLKKTLVDVINFMMN